MNKKAQTKYLLDAFRKMSGDKKIRMAMKLSELVRKVRSEGAKATGTSYGVRST